MAKTSATKNSTPVTVDLRQQAKEAYFRYEEPSEISRRLGVSPASLAKWRREDSWVAEREATERGIIEDGFSYRKVTISRITNMSVDQLDRGLKHLTTRAEPPSLQEMEKLSTILANLDKISRLDAGKATDNIAVQAKAVMPTADEIRKILLADPMLAPDEVKDAT